MRYYGYFSNVSRGKRKKLNPEGEGTSWKPEVIEVAPPPVSKELKKRWFNVIQKVYETDPLVCLKWALLYPCGGPHWAAVFVSEAHLTDSRRNSIAL